MKAEINGIPGMDGWIVIEPVLKGWSGERKYYVEDASGRKLLLRVAENANVQRRQAEFEAISRFNRLDYPMSQAVDYGLCNEGRNSYLLLTWVEGDSLEEQLAEMSPQRQHQLGIEAGEILRGLHQLPLDTELPHWDADMRGKMLARLQEYEACPYRLEGDGQVLAFVRENIGLIEDTRKVRRHGDFHIGNLIYTPEGKIGVIDFNRWDCGDYAEEFYKLQFFDRERSVPFARGRLDGYFGGKPPQEFWGRQALYVAYASLYSIKWAIPFGAADVASMMERGLQAFADYCGYEGRIPRWYTDAGL